MTTDARQESPWLQGKVVLVLCGLIASGKSTFAQQLEQQFPHFRRCNQDDLGNRQNVERLTRETLARGQSVCIDRTNFNEQQRSYWIDIAHEFPGTSVWVIVFDTPYEICEARLYSRTSHPTIKSPEQGVQVLSRFAADFERPTAREGYNRIIYLKPTDHASPIYSRDEIAAILERVYSSPPVVSPINSMSSRTAQSFQGWQPKGDFYRGHPACGNFGASRENMRRNPGFRPYAPLSVRRAWQPGYAGAAPQGTQSNSHDPASRPSTATSAWNISLSNQKLPSSTDATAAGSGTSKRGGFIG